MIHCQWCGEARPFHAQDCRIPLLTTAVYLDGQ